MSKSKKAKAINEAAAMLGRNGGKKSAESRFSGLSPEEISERMKALRKKREDLKNKDIEE